MIIEYYRASKYGNGAAVAAELAADMAARGVTVNVHHIKDAVQVAASEGPLEDGWRTKVAALADAIAIHE